MPELTLQNILFFICVGAFTLTAAVCDIRTRRIPNKLTLPVFVLGLIFQTAFNGWSGTTGAGIAAGGLQSALLGFAIGFGTLFVLWMVGGGGGGDVKLMGALSVWLGFRLTLLVMICSTALVIISTVGAMLGSLIKGGRASVKKQYLATRKPIAAGQRKVEETVEQRQKRRIMAYAVPVALATWLVVIWKLPEM